TFKTVPGTGDISERQSNKTIKTEIFQSNNWKNVSSEAVKINPLTFEFEKSNGFIVQNRSETGEVTWMKGFVYQDKSQNLDFNAQSWLDAAAKVMNINQKSDRFEINAIHNDDKSQSHIRMDQLHHGIKVYGSEIILHAQNGKIFSQNGNYVSSAYLPGNTKVAISDFVAEEVVKKNLDNYHEDWNKLKKLGFEIGIDRWNTELVYYKHQDEFLLVYHISVYPNLGEHFEYFIDASNGQIIHHFSTICRAHNHDFSNDHKKEMIPPPDGPKVANATDLFGINRTIDTYEVDNIYFMIDGSREMFSSSQSIMPNDPVGAIWTVDLNNTSPINSNAEYTHVASEDNQWAASPEGVSAHYNGGKAYEYFKQTFGRESISGTGQNIISFVNVADEDGSSLGNAFWNGLGIYYGNGSNEFFPLGRGLDVAGHEMSHGVVQTTANLEYYGEPGAMNESFADIFGAMIDRDDWLIGEDVVRPGVFASGALRSMSDPHNGAQTGDFGRGWQPKHTNEKFNGPEDNNGVHINSGIPNHAFYLFANTIGKDRAEQIFYRALTSYLTRSSGFKELRFAVVQSANDLYGQAEVDAARAAFDQVGITDESQGDFEEEVDINPGADLLMVSDQDRNNILIFDLATQDAVFSPLTDIPQLSKPSITDDGSRVVFVGTDNHIYLIDIDWNSSPPSSSISQVSYEPDWRNAVISKDGSKVALLDVSFNNEIIIIDIPSNTENTFELTNPSFTEGVETGDVLFADALEFDITGNILMYDAINEIQSADSGTLEYWDIAFLEVWNSAADTWALGRIDKLFSALPEGISIGNPTFAKNSPYIIAMDFLDGQDFSILGVNIENGDIAEIFPNSGVGYPNYSRDDRFMIYDLEIIGYVDLGILELNDDKISRVNNSDNILGQSLRWGVWFSNGSRNLNTNVEDILIDPSVLSIAPNPASDIVRVTLDSEELKGKVKLEITDIMGRKILEKNIDSQDLINYEVDLAELQDGSYVLTLRSEEKLVSRKLIVE
ncbi:MAG: M4 family metallopeptidase, partial [Bacteroidia bacterium]|nr:M4 family metallopeptidase [Bacteroidia bacterium]